MSNNQPEKPQLNPLLEEIRFSRLEDAYGWFSEILGHPEAYKLGCSLREAVKWVQLYASAETINWLGSWIEAAKVKKNACIAELDPLLDSLRGDIRYILGLTTLTGPIQWISIGPPEAVLDASPDKEQQD